MIAEVYDAFKEAGASDEKARAAATALAGTDDRLARIETDLAMVKAELAMVRWIVSGVGFGVFDIGPQFFLARVKNDEIVDRPRQEISDADQPAADIKE